MIEERKALHGEAKRLEERLAEQEAQALLAVSGPQGPSNVRVVSAAIEDASPGYLVLLAARLAKEPHVVALVASRSNGHVVFAQSKGLPRNMGTLLRDTLKEFGGKGGGPKDFAQGSVVDAGAINALLERAKESLAL